MKITGKKRLPGLLLWIFAAAVLLLQHPETACGGTRDSQVEIQTTYGFGGCIKGGNSVPFTVRLHNTGMDFSGQLEIRIPMLADSVQLSDSIWMGGNSYGQNSNDRVYCYVKDLDMKAGETRTEVLYPQFPSYEGTVYTEVKSGENLLGSSSVKVDSTVNNSRILVGIVSGDLSGLEDLDGMQVKLESQYPVEAFVKAIPLTSQEVYPNPESLEHLDVLIADEGTLFTEEQQLALSVWQNNGGFYITRKQESLKKLTEDLIYGEQQEVFARKISESGSYVLGETGILDTVPIKDHPSVIRYLLLLLIYILLAGPGLYVILKKREKRNYLWVCLCGLSVLFVLLMGILGSRTSIRAPIISYNGLYIQEGDIWTEDLKFGIQAPYNEEVQMYVNSRYRLNPWETAANGGTLSAASAGENIGIALQDQKNKITIRQVPVFRQSYFTLKYNERRERDQRILSQLQGTDQDVSGFITNNTPYTLKDCVLMVRNRGMVLGTLESGESIRLDHQELEGFTDITLDRFLNQYLEFQNYRYPDYESENYNRIMNDAELEIADDQVLLLGIVQNPDLSFQENSGYDIYGTTMMKAYLNTDWSEEGRTYCPNLEAYGESEDGSFYRNSNLLYYGEMTVDYPAGDLIKLTMKGSVLADEQYYQPFRGTVAFYNWSKEEFVEIQDWEKTYTSLELTPYLSDKGILRIQYQAVGLNKNSQISYSLPYLSAVRKAES